MIYQVSYVVRGSKHPGAFINQFIRPEVGDTVEIGDEVFKIEEVQNILPPRGDFQFLHVTVIPASEAEAEAHYEKQKSEKTQKS